MEKRPLFLFAGGFVLGEVLGLQNQTAVKILAVAVFVAAAGWVLLNHIEKKEKGKTTEKGEKAAGEYPVSFIRIPKKSRILGCGWLLFFVFCGWMRGDREFRKCEQETALALDGEKRSFAGRVDRIRESGERYEILLKAVESDQGESLRGLLIYVDPKQVGLQEAESDRQGARSLTLAAAKEYPEIAGAGESGIVVPVLGMEILVEGKVSVFEAAGNPGQFDYQSYYRAQKLSYRMNATEVEIIGRYPGMYDWYRNQLRRAVMVLGDILDEVADEMDAGILKSLLLGDKSSLDPEIRDLYQKNGIAHLLAISGLHLSLISMAVYGMLRKLGSGYGAAGLIGGIVLISYCVMTGGSASSVRALVMVLCGYLAAYLGRTYDILTALGLAGILILWESPWQLTQSGIQLSFAAVAGIAAAQETKALPVSLALQAVTVPVLLWHYFQLPLYGFLINLLVLPLLGGVIGSGTLMVFSGFIHRPAARFFAGTAHYILMWYDWLCHFFQELPGANQILGRPAAWQIGLYYGSLAVLLRYLGEKESGKSSLESKRDEQPDKNHKKDENDNNNVPGDSLGMIEKIREMIETAPETGRKLLKICFLMLVLLPFPVRDFQVTFLDVGQGDGIFLHKGNFSVLIDGGSSSVSELGENRLEPYLKSQAVTKLDYAIVSHGDQDHISGLEYLLGPESDIRIDALVLPAAGCGDEIYGELCDMAMEGGTSVFWMETGDRMETGDGLNLTCLYPDNAQGHPSKERNDHSLVIRCDYGNFHMLLTGDMSEEGEKEILSGAGSLEDLSEISTLKIAHHGSATATSAEWLDVISPIWAVISYGKNNRYGHPNEKVMEKLTERDITIFQTALDGAVTLRTDGEVIEWNTFLPGERDD